MTAKDLENPWIGQIGVQAAEVKMGSNETPLVARMPFYVRVDENGILQFEALKIEENIDRVPIEIKYKRIVLPEFEFKVVGQNGVHKIKLNEDEFIYDYLNFINLIPIYISHFWIFCNDYNKQQ